MFFVLTINEKKRENIATPSGYIFVFRDEVLNINYTNISVKTNSKSVGDTLSTQIAPWNNPSPLASN